MRNIKILQLKDKKQIKNIWEWLNEITVSKSSISDISEESWDTFNSYMVNRFISMNVEYIELANYVQSIPYDNKKQLYSIYREMIPKRKVWLKYIKGTSKTYQPQLIEHICDYFECGKSTATEYLGVLKKDETLNILEKMGIEDKEAKKLLKK